MRSMTKFTRCWCGHNSWARNREKTVLHQPYTGLSMIFSQFSDKKVGFRRSQALGVSQTA